MCGRYTLRTPAQDIADFFELDEVPDLAPRFNIAPTQAVAAVRRSADSRGRHLALLHWGLIPSWADDPKIGYSTINARAETVSSKPSFRSAFKKRRCLIAADGFYEWQKTGDKNKKQPFLIHRRDAGPFALAGLWERWKRDELVIESCTIIVTEPNELVRPIHDRMPVILSPQDFDLWLDPAVDDVGRLEALLRPAPAADLEAIAVSTRVNNPASDVPECVVPLAETE